MLEIPSEILAHLELGGTVLVPTRQRAAVLRIAHSAKQLSAGRRIWSSPDILPWSAWVERGLSEARARGEAVPRRLSVLEEWLLWREAVLDVAGASVLSPAGLVQPVRRAVGILENYGLRLSEQASPEARLLVRAQGAYEARCRERGALGLGSWRACAPFLRPSSRLLLAGFTTLGTARREWLAQHQACWVAAEPPEDALTPMRTVSLPDARAQAEAAADWCANALRSEPRARLLLVVPRLAEQRHLWERALRDRLEYEAVLTGSHSAQGALFALEGGQPLERYTLVGSALSVLALAAGQASFEQLSVLLRSNYLAPGERATRLRLDAWLRTEGPDVTSLPALQRLAQSARFGAGAEALQLIQRWGASLCVPERAPESWAQQFAAWLTASGWPGGPLGSDELQVRVRFDELLGELAAAEVAGAPRSLGEMLGLLHELAALVAFEPASDDVAVTVTAALEDPIVRYDGIWVAGLAADTWPPPARPDPFIPLSLQHQAGIPEASAAGQLKRAQQLQRGWRAAAVRCVASWASSDEGLAADPSPLLPSPAADGQVLAGTTFSAESWVAASAVPRLIWYEGPAPRWEGAGVLAGGTRLLELQARCPFRSVAELRLGAVALPEPSPGIDARQRGKILHRALELLWRSLLDQGRLKRLSAAQRRELIDQCSDAAVRGLAAELPGEVQALLLERERERTRRLLGELIEWELQRPDFRIEALEHSEELSLAGARLRLRLDRIDRLDDGRRLVIDYKSGRAQRLDPQAPRPTMPQLPAYATVLGPAVAAVVALYVGRRGVRAHGVADQDGRVPRLPTVHEGPEAWPALLAQWREQLTGLLEEFVRGHAAVAPQPHACDLCHLQLLCRIEASRLVPQQDAPDEAEGAAIADDLESWNGSD